jgi:hypothetical protein
MQNIIKLIDAYQPYILIGLAVLVIILLLLLISVLKSLNNLESKYRRLMRGTTGKNIEELIVNNLGKIDQAKEETEYMKELYKSVDKRLKECIQKVSVVRYRAFENVGSDLSYSIAFLDENNDGVILTGIFGRNESTTYAKPVDKGISRYDLSLEEQQVLKNSMSKNTK